jgi:hypothetical protein
METSASFEARSAPLPYPTVNALVRICAGGDQRWSSLPRHLRRNDTAALRRPCSPPPCATPVAERGRVHGASLPKGPCLTVPLLSLGGGLRVGRLFRQHALQDQVGIDLQSSHILVKRKALAMAGEA